MEYAGSVKASNCNTKWRREIDPHPTGQLSILKTVLLPSIMCKPRQNEQSGGNSTVSEMMI